MPRPRRRLRRGLPAGGTAARLSAGAAAEKRERQAAEEIRRAADAAAHEDHTKGLGDALAELESLIQASETNPVEPIPRCPECLGPVDRPVQGIHISAPVPSPIPPCPGCGRGRDPRDRDRRCSQCRGVLLHQAIAGGTSVDEPPPGVAIPESPSRVLTVTGTAPHPPVAGSKDRTERLVSEYLERYPGAKSPAIATAINCSSGYVRKTKVWISEQAKRNASKAEPKLRTTPLTQEILASRGSDSIHEPWITVSAREDAEKTYLAGVTAEEIDAFHRLSRGEQDERLATFIEPCDG